MQLLLGYILFSVTSKVSVLTFFHALTISPLHLFLRNLRIQSNRWDSKSQFYNPGLVCYRRNWTLEISSPHRSTLLRLKTRMNCNHTGRKEQCNYTFTPGIEHPRIRVNHSTVLRRPFWYTTPFEIILHFLYKTFKTYPGSQVLATASGCQGGHANCTTKM